MGNHCCTARVQRLIETSNYVPGITCVTPPNVLEEGLTKFPAFNQWYGYIQLCIIKDNLECFHLLTVTSTVLVLWVFFYKVSALISVKLG